MFNAIKLILALALPLMLLPSCGNSREDAANSLLQEARQLVAVNDYQGAMALLDTLDVTYRDAVDVRRQGTCVRAEALIALTADSIAADEARRPSMIAAHDSLQRMFKHINLAGTDGYYVHSKTYTGREMSTTGLQARVDDKGYFFVVVNLSGRSIGLNAVEYGGAMTTPAQSMSVEGSEIMSLPQESLSTLSAAIDAAPAGALKVKLLGTKGTATAKLSAAQAEAYRTTWRYARLKQMVQQANARREKYERQMVALQEKLDAMPAETSDNN